MANVINRRTLVAGIAVAAVGSTAAASAVANPDAALIELGAEYERLLAKQLSVGGLLQDAGRICGLGADAARRHGIDCWTAPCNQQEAGPDDIRAVQWRDRGAAFAVRAGFRGPGDG